MAHSKTLQTCLKSPIENIGHLESQLVRKLFGYIKAAPAAKYHSL